MNLSFFYFYRSIIYPRGVYNVSIKEIWRGGYESSMLRQENETRRGREKKNHQSFEQDRRTDQRNYQDD